MNITILGGGNIGTLIAAECARKGHSVTLYTSRPGGWSTTLEVYDKNDVFLFSSRIFEVTDDIAHAVDATELILITLPAETFPSLAQELLPLIRNDQQLGFVPGSGGAEFAFCEFIQKGGTLFGFQRVHSIARLKQRGHSVYMLGRKEELQLAAIPQSKAEGMARIMEGLFDMPCKILPNYLVVTLTPSNPILHTARLFSLFKDYRNQPYPRNFLFYEEWDDVASAMLLNCDDELQQLCDCIPLDLTEVKSLRIHYESNTILEMTKKIASIPAFKNLLSPMIKNEEGWLPDFSSRYFSTDFAFGLKILLDLCHLFSISAPSMEHLWQWYISVNTPNYRFELNLTKEKFLALYR